jgi:DNA transformation protein and related proteins
MAVSKEYLDYAMDQLGRVAPVTSRRMFGGVGIYSDGLFFALVDDDRLYFKVDETNRGDFEEEGMKPFKPFGEEAKPMQYYELPGDLLEDHHLLRPWVEKATRVARNAAARKGKKKKG